jgi:hypothetical protein
MKMITPVELNIKVLKKEAKKKKIDVKITNRCLKRLEKFAKIKHK